MKNGNFEAGKTKELTIVLIQTISQYLRTNKRLVIPQLGAFIVKQPGVSVVFSELLKRDDGVLRGVLCAEGMSEIEAAAQIDRFVFEVRHAVESGCEFRLGGLGVLRPGPGGTTAFDYDPQPVPEPEQGDGQCAERDGALLAEQAEPASGLPPSASGQNEQEPKNAASRVRVSPSVKLNPEPCVKGLRYGKPHKNTDSYTFVGKSPRRRVDRFLLAAVVAALIAVAAIAFGYFRAARDKQAKAAVEQVEQTEQVVPETAAPSNSNNP